MTSALPPAGWYGDPDPQRAGQLRYWDGSVWTEHVAPIPAPLEVPEYASLGRRALGFTGDAAIVMVLCGWFARVLHWAVGDPWWTPVPISLVVAATWFAYQWLSLRQWSATPGMRVLGMSVRYLTGNSGRANVRRAAVFSIVFGASFVLGVFGPIGSTVQLVVPLLFLIGCLSMGRPLGQTWHDRWSDTQILDNRNVRPGDDGADATSSAPALSTTTRYAIYTLIGIGLILYLVFSVVNLVTSLDAVVRQVPEYPPYWPDSWK